MHDDLIYDHSKEREALGQAIAMVVERVATEGIPMPRDIDVAHDYIMSFAEEWVESVAHQFTLAHPNLFARVERATKVLALFYKARRMIFEARIPAPSTVNATDAVAMVTVPKGVYDRMLEIEKMIFEVTK